MEELQQQQQEEEQKEIYKQEEEEIKQKQQEEEQQQQEEEDQQQKKEEEEEETQQKQEEKIEQEEDKKQPEKEEQQKIEEQPEKQEQQKMKEEVIEEEKIKTIPPSIGLNVNKDDIYRMKVLLDEEIRYARHLEGLLKQNGIPISRPDDIKPISIASHRGSVERTILLNQFHTAKSTNDYEQVLKATNELMPPNPGVEVRFNQLCYSVLTPKDDVPIPTFASAISSLATSPITKFSGKSTATKTYILQNLSGVLKPKSFTLVLGKPGSGKTSFLKALAQKLHVNKKCAITGDLTYNGDKPGKNTFEPSRVLAYVPQEDNHLPTLSVYETLTFAATLQDEVFALEKFHKAGYGNTDAELIQIRKKFHKRQEKIEILLKLLGISHVRDTVVGNDLIRGISGGQKKRVTLCEFLTGSQKVMLMDEISTGLDSSTTIDILRDIRLGTGLLDLTTVVSLLQPPPEVFELFDNVILLDEGRCTYYGPCADLSKYLNSIGYICPIGKDIADFAQEISSSEGLIYFTPNENYKEPLTNSKDFYQAFQDSGYAKAIAQELQKPLENKPEWSREQKIEFLTTWTRATRECTKRQWKLRVRNKELLIAELGQPVAMGLLMGSLFYQLSDDQYTNRYGLFFIAAMFCALGSLPELEGLVVERSIFYKQNDSNFFSASSYMIAQSICMFPVLVAQVVVFGTFLWWMCGMTDEENGSRYGLFIIISLCLACCVNQMLRIVSCLSPTPGTAFPMAGGMIVLMILFSGFIIAEDSIPSYWIWLYWLNPIAYGMRAFAVLEFNSNKYSILTPTGNRLGDLYLDAYGFRKDDYWVWVAILFCIASYFISTLICVYCLNNYRFFPTKRPPRHELVRNTMVDMETLKTKYSLEEAEAGERSEVALPFEPATLTFENIWYTVELPSKNITSQPEKLDLLKGVTGYAVPGSLTALMGSSGAGKTTLLDVISGRKTGGVIQGEIKINGHEKVHKSFARMSGYVEQTDIHSPHSTVYESLQFSARLRLSSDISTEIRNKFVNEVLTILELDNIRNDLIGNHAEGGLSAEQKKRVTIGVELVANPSLLFLDEPTSGLDSRAAAIVMRAVRNVAKTNRTVVCTIHQPSAYLFEMFHNLLLLQKGGQTVYFGPLGNGSKHLLDYLYAIPGVVPMSEGTNPATYMLDVIGKKGQVHVDFSDYYAESNLKQINEAKLNELKEPKIKLEFDSEFASTTFTQFIALVNKSIRNYWRSPNYNVTRTLIGIFVALLFGSVYARRPIKTQSDIIARISVVFVAITFTCVIYIVSVLDPVGTERAVYYREQAARMYRPLPYALSFTLAEIPYIIVNSLLFSVAFYFTIGLDDDAAKFWYFWLFFALSLALSTFFGQFLATAAPSNETAAVIGPLFLQVWSVFCGFLISPANIPNYWIFMYWLSPFHYSLEGYVVTQFKDNHQIIQVVTQQGFVPMTVEDYALKFFGGEFSFDNIGKDLIGLFAFILAFDILRGFALKYVRHINR